MGDAPYADAYIASLRAAAGPEVRFPGYVFGDGYAELVHRCGVMCVPTEVGGTHPVIVEAMSAGAALVVSDHPPNVDVVGDTAATFPLAEGADGLARTLERLISDPRDRRRLGEAAAARAAERFSWDTCAEAYLALCRGAREAAGLSAEPPAAQPGRGSRWATSASLGAVASRSDTTIGRSGHSIETSGSS